MQNLDNNDCAERIAKIVVERLDDFMSMMFNPNFSFKDEIWTDVYYNMLLSKVNDPLTLPREMVRRILTDNHATITDDELIKYYCSAVKFVARKLSKQIIDNQ